jgi:hypothetical protein
MEGMEEDTDMQTNIDNNDDEEGLLRSARISTMTSLLRSYYLRHRREIEDAQIMARP